MTSRRWYIPSVAFVLCILVQLRILFVVPTQKDNITCLYMASERKHIQEIIPPRQTERDRLDAIYGQWMSEFKNRLLGVELAKNITYFLLSGLETLRNSSDSYTIFRELGIQRAVTIGITISDRGLIEKTFRTIDSLIEENAGNDRKTFHIVLLVSMRDKELGANVSTEALRKYSDFYEGGQVHILLGPTDLYDKLGVFHHAAGYVRKESLDYALLFMYSKELARYYIQMEPGIICNRYIIHNILKIAGRQTGVWFSLDFGHFGFIGTMFHSSFLQSMAELLASRFSTKNVNVLLRQLYQSLSKRKLAYINSSPCIHHDVERLKSRFSFDRGTNSTVLMGDNPSAVIITTMHRFGDFWPSMAYDNDNYTVFWTDSVAIGDSFRLKFNSPVNITRIIVVTGGERPGQDMLTSGYLRVGVGKPKCVQLTKRGVFVKGYVDTIEQGIGTFPSDITCLSIDVTRKQKQWLVIRDIKVFVLKSDT